MATRKNKPKTAGYKPIDMRWQRQPRDLAIMSFEDILWMMREPTICLGLEMRAAPLSAAEYEVESDSETVKRYVTAQLDTIWEQLSALDTAQVWGWSACEVMTRQTLAGTLEITELLSRHANDTRAITVDGQVRAVRFNRIEGAPTGHVDLPVGDVHSTLGPPKAIFHAHDPGAGAVYGTSILEGAFSPWCDKWHKGGALDVRRLTMWANAISGRKMWYPDGSMEIPGHTTPVPNRDTARVIVEQIQSGGVATMPSDMDEHGNQRWQLEEAKALAGLEFILQYPKDLDIEILRGMKIPDDVIMSQADSSGAWAGKQVPQAAFYTGLTRWLTRMIQDIRRCILDYLVWFNFGPGHWYKITPKPLAEQAMEAQKKPGDSQNAAQPQPQYPGHDGNGNGNGRMPMPQRMGLDPVEAVGRGVLDAGELVEAARRVIRLSTDKVGHEHGEKGSGKGGQFVEKGGAGSGKAEKATRTGVQFKPKPPSGNNDWSEMAKTATEAQWSQIAEAIIAHVGDEDFAAHVEWESQNSFQGWKLASGGKHPQLVRARAAMEQLASEVANSAARDRLMQHAEARRIPNEELARLHGSSMVSSLRGASTGHNVSSQDESDGWHIAVAIAANALKTGNA